MTELVQKTYDHMRELQRGEASGHDWQHTLRVYRMAVRLWEGQTQPADRQTVELATLLHDIADWKLCGGDETAGPAAAARWLQDNGAPPELTAHVEEIIRDLSYKGAEVPSPMPTLEGKLVQDADRLDAVGAVGVARCFAYGGAFGKELFDPALPPRLRITPRQYADPTEKSTSVNHFYEKLLLLRERYNTPEAAAIGAARHRALKAFLREFLAECGEAGGEHDRLLDQF